MINNRHLHIYTSTQHILMHLWAPTCVYTYPPHVHIFVSIIQSHLMLRIEQKFSHIEQNLPLTTPVQAAGLKQDRPELKANPPWTDTILPPEQNRKGPPKGS